MARFCMNCGNKLEDTDRVCGTCGTPAPQMAPQGQPMGMPQMAQQAQPMGIPQMAPQGQPMGAPQMAPMQQGYPYPAGGPVKPAKQGGKKLSKKAIIGISVAAVAVIAIGVILYFVLGGGKGNYESAIKDTFTCLENEDMDGITDMVPDIVYDAYEEMERISRKKAVKELERAIEIYLEEVRDDVGKIQSFDYEITDELDIEQKYLSMGAMYLAMEEGIDVDFDSVKDVKIVEMKITAEGKKKDKTYKEQCIVLVREKSGWKSLPLFMSGDKISVDEIKDRLDEFDNMDFDDLF